MPPLILITNDDGYQSRGLHQLVAIASELGEVVVMAPEHNSSGLSTSITCTRPMRVHSTKGPSGIEYHYCDGTPADCVKMGIEYFCPRPPDLVLSGINYGSNASINIAYSGTMGAVLEACLDGCQSIGFSLLNHSPEADFEAASSFIRHIIDSVLHHPLPDYTALNVNIPRLDASQIKGIRVCRQARASWVDSLEKRIDPIGRPYWWMTGKFVCDNPGEDSDEYALANGYISVVPVSPDFTNHSAINILKHLES
ncbi:MAG: 5'/3'-nucleotidase SurE [Bacteroidales bacterium]|jgi:5'-nucleotidase|nr:5'/3'-nucleotidase SurE [Bacteroidales bacterium]